MGSRAAATREEGVRTEPGVGPESGAARHGHTVRQPRHRLAHRSSLMGGNGWLSAESLVLAPQKTETRVTRRYQRAFGLYLVPPRQRESHFL